MIDYIKCLEEFHKGVGDKFPVEFIDNDYNAKLRSRLILEEAQEASDELLDGTKDLLLKELCDCLYVLFGTAVTYGLPIEEAFIRVHENNMLKTTYDRDLFGKITKPKDHPKVNLKDLL